MAIGSSRKKVTGGSGKDYIFGNNGSITVNRPDGTSSTVNKGDAMYDKTVSAMGQDGIKFPSSGGSNRPSSSGGLWSSSSGSSSSSSWGGGKGGNGGYNYDNEIKRKALNGIALTNPTKEARSKYEQYKLGAIGNKLYNTSDSNKTMYGNNYSTHLMKQAGDKSWVSDRYGRDEGGEYLIKAQDGRKVYRTAENSKYFADNYGGSGGFLYDDKNQVTYKADTKDMRTDSKYHIYGDVGTNSAEKQALKKQQEEFFRSMSKDELAKYKENSTSQLEKNFISTIDGTMANDSSYNYSPIALAPTELQTQLTDLVYDEMRKKGIQNFEGLDTKTLDEAINKSGLGGMFDINQVNTPFLEEQLMHLEAKQAGGEAEYRIDGKALLDTLATSGALKEGYTYNQETGEIGIDDNYTQVGDMLVDKGEATRWYGNQEGHALQRKRQENIDNQMYEEPLEWRAKYNPESMTEEMKQDLQMEREIKAQLEQLTLELQYLEEQEGGNGVPMVLGGGIGTGGSGSGQNGSGLNGNGSGSGIYGNGGESTYNQIRGGGKGAVYGVSQNYTNADSSLLNAIKRRM